jgi:hypothetical protein
LVRRTSAGKQLNRFSAPGVVEPGAIFMTSEKRKETPMSYVHANLTRVTLAELDISLQQLSAFSGVNINKISPWISGTKDIGNLELEKINTTIHNLEQLVELAHPWPIDFRRVGAIKNLLDRLRNGEFDRPLEAQVR